MPRSVIGRCVRESFWTDNDFSAILANKNEFKSQQDAVSKTEDRYYTAFEWLIRPLGLDFVDDHFRETREGLFWEGQVNDIPAVIEAKFPVHWFALQSLGSSRRALPCPRLVGILIDEHVSTNFRV